MTQQQFVTDLKSFIETHPYYRENEGTFMDIPENDQASYEIRDPDGDYEALEIILNFIP